MDKNICLFTPYHKDYNSIHTINFVLETKLMPYTQPFPESVYKIHYINTGNGVIHTPGKNFEVSEGDVFFTFPASPFSIESKKDFSYMYISFLGSRANMIMDKLKISPNNFHFKNCGEISDFWKNGLNANPELSDLISESILLYTFTFLGNKILTYNSTDKQKDHLSMLVKKYIDDNYSIPSLSLETISSALSYNKKYISSTFKKNMGMGIAEYLTTLRIQHSCTLMEQGFTSVYDISTNCGFSDSHYFSKVFKKKMGLSPSEYIKKSSSRHSGSK